MRRTLPALLTTLTLLMATAAAPDLTDLDADARAVRKAKAAAELELRRRREVARPAAFNPWLKEVTPAWSWDWPHLLHVQAQLDRVTRGELKKLILSVPPRHGKTEQGTVRYPVFRLERRPETRVILAAYNQTLAEKFSRKARKIARERLDLSRERTAASDWETSAGGGVRATGVGGGVTGMGADLIVIDDPIKSRKEANSEAYREAVWEWYCDDLYTRQEPGCAIVLTMTRWHEDDLVGRILASEDGPNWTVINLPALAEENDPLGREPGRALCPERYDEAALEGIRTVLRSSFYALFQGSPRPKEGGFFKYGWFRVVACGPAHADRVRYWDIAGTDGDGDFTVGVRMARTEDGLFFVEDVARGQWSPKRRNEEMRATAERDGGSVKVFVEREAGIGAEERNREIVRALAGFPVRIDPVTGKKEARADSFAAQAEAGNVRLLKGPWNHPYLNELADFPSGKHDDQVDATSGAFNKLANRRVSRMT